MKPRAVAGAGVHSLEAAIDFTIDRVLYATNGQRVSLGMELIAFPHPVIPAQAGIHGA